MYNQNLGVDTNVLFSALFYQGKPHKILEKVVRAEVKLWISEYIQNELLGVVNRLSLSKEIAVEFFSLQNVRIVADEGYCTPKALAEAEKIVRDKKDAPIYAFAKFALERKMIDEFITGDLDLLTAEVRKQLNNQIKTPAEYLSKEG